jgi:SAM-dependent methyltransferase
MGTGGGEFLASLPGLPKSTHATEGYPPNLPIAHQRLAPLGISVVPVVEDGSLPLAAEAFDLVINRHESYELSEVWRILKPRGVFLTQQVGPRNCIQLNQYLGGPLEADALNWTFTQEKSTFEAAGFQIIRAEEALLDSIFYDIGAVVFYLKVIAWQIPDFSIEKYEPRLRALHRTLGRQGAFFTTAHRFLIEAQKK